MTNTIQATNDRLENLTALNAYIRKMNAEFEARMKAEGATFWATFGLNADDMAELFNVHTVEEFIKWQADTEEQAYEKEARKASYDM
jgi:hypothetical protein